MTRKRDWFKHEEVAPSLFAGNCGHFASSVRQIIDAGHTWVHFDIMDGHFVPNLSFGPKVVADLRQQYPEVFFDVHLMLTSPQKFIDAFVAAGADLITFHVEASCDVKATIQAIQSAGCRVGLALNPSTPVEALRPWLADLDLVLIMTVEPGFCGQKFMETCLTKMSTVHHWIQSSAAHCRLQVDGGINVTTRSLCRDAGADTFVMGSAFFNI